MVKNNNEPIKWNITIRQGATFREYKVWKVGTTPENVQPVDLTSCTGRMQVRSKIKSPEILIEFTTEKGNMILTAEGEIILELSATETAAIDWKKGVFDLEIEFPDEYVRRLFYGSVTVSQEVTRSD